MGKVIDVLNYILNSNLIKSLIVVLGSLLIYNAISILLSKSEKKRNLKKSGKSEKTYFRLIRNFLKYAFIVIVVLAVLQINGIDVSSMIAGVGVLSIIIGFIVQDAFKDIIRGVDIVSDKYFSVGDIVKYGDIEGKVLMVGMKTTKIEDIRTSNVISIANRNIEQIEVVSNNVYINIPMPYEVEINRAEKIISIVTEEIYKNENVESCKYIGVNEIGDSSINYMINIECNPKNKLQVRRDALGTIIRVLNANKIEIPYKQIDIHSK